MTSPVKASESVENPAAEDAPPKVVVTQTPKSEIPGLTPEELKKNNLKQGYQSAFQKSDYKIINFRAIFRPQKAEFRTIFGPEMKNFGPISGPYHI